MLKSQCFNNKVTYTTFSECLKNHILSNFEDIHDMVPLILQDTMPDVILYKPVDLQGKDLNSKIKTWLKMEEVKLHAKRTKNLKDNKQILFRVVWGQFSLGLQQVVKGSKDYSVSAAAFDIIWLLVKGKLDSSGIDEKSKKYMTLFQDMSVMCTLGRVQRSQMTLSKKGLIWQLYLYL